MYPDRVYPNYLSGTGYVMSSVSIGRLYKAALSTPLFHLEDIYITGTSFIHSEIVFDNEIYYTGGNTKCGL